MPTGAISPPWNVPHHLGLLAGRCRPDDGEVETIPFPERLLRLLPGLLLVAAVAAVATVVGGLVPVVGAPVVAIVTGIAVAVARQPSERLRPGLAFSARSVLQGSIIVLGTGLSLHQVLATGVSSMPVLLGTLVAALLAAWGAGRLLRLPRDLTTLVGIGTAICGASAIAATDAVIGAEEADVGYAVATIFTFNVVAVLTYPTVGHLIGMSQHAFGLWAGTAINDASSVVAASTVYGHRAATFGVVVKLTRTLAIVPVTLALAAWRGRRTELVGSGARGGTAAAHGLRTATAPTDHGVGGAPQWRRTAHLRRTFPTFVLGFVAAVALNSAGLVPAGWHHGLSDIATWMITMALAAIGLSTRPQQIRRAGGRPLLLGAILWATVGVVSLALQAATGTL